MVATDKFKRSDLPQLSENPLVIFPCDAEVQNADTLIVIDFSKGAGLVGRKKYIGEKGEIVLADCKQVGEWSLFINEASNRVFVAINQNGNPIPNFVGGGIKDRVGEVQLNGVDATSEGGKRSIIHQLSIKDYSLDTTEDDTVFELGVSIGESVLSEIEDLESQHNPVTQGINKMRIALLFILAGGIAFGAVAVAKHHFKKPPVTDTSTAP